MKQYVPLFENYIKESGDEQYEVWETFDEIQREECMKIINDVAKLNLDRQQWDVAPYARVRKIWEDYTRTGVIRDSRGLESIADLIVKNIIKLYCNTVLSSHTQENPKHFIEYNTGYYFKGETPLQSDDEELSITFEEFDERTEEYFYDDKWGQYRISDYAMQPLLLKANEIMMSKNDAEKLILIDQVFNIVHPRGDIASLFIEGGSKSLQELFERPSEISEALTWYGYSKVFVAWVDPAGKEYVMDSENGEEHEDWSMQKFGKSRHEMFDDGWANIRILWKDKDMVKDKAWYTGPMSTATINAGTEEAARRAAKTIKDINSINLLGIDWVVMDWGEKTKFIHKFYDMRKNDDRAELHSWL